MTETSRARARYDEDLKNYRDRIMDQETRRLERKKARTEGLKAGRAEGRARILETSMKLKQAGITVETIIQCTGQLTTCEINHPQKVAKLV